MKKGLLVAVILLSAFIVGGLTIGALYNKSVFELQKTLQQPAPTLVPTPQPEPQAKLPSIFPKDFPVFPLAQLVDSWVDSEDQAAVSVIWETSAGLEEVTDFYREELAGSSWEVDSDLTATGSAALSFVGDEGEGFVGISDKGDLRAISVTIGLNADN